MKLKSLAAVRRREPREIVLAALPQEVPMARFAREKAFTINELIRVVYGESLEWYGYTLGDRARPDLVIDVGLPRNEQNIAEYTHITPQKIQEYQESLPPTLVINGWIHSHGNLPYQEFSDIDEENHLTVLDYVTSLLRKPVAKREVLVEDLSLLVKDRITKEDLVRGSVALVTDAPVKEVQILETVYGGFCYGIVIGDGGWHRQEILYKSRGILSGQTRVSKREADLVLIDTGRGLTPSDVDRLRDEVRENLRPMTNPPTEQIERM
jgi:hypothetical protein